MEKKELLVLKNNEITKDYVAKYLSYIDVTDNTIKSYASGLKEFFKYLADNGIENPKREDVIAFREYLKENHKEATINSYLTAVKNFFSWLEYEGITKNVTENVKCLKIGKEHKRNALTQEQCKEIISKVKDIREKTIFILAATCGLRANELVNIRLEDFKQKESKICLYVLGKGRDYKEDFVIVDNSVYDIIKEYIKKYNINDYLFTSISNHNKGGKLTTKTMRFIVKNMYKRVGIEGDEYSLHSCRHFFATESIKSGMDIREVSQALRHKRLETTTIYLHDMEKLENKCSSKVANCLLGGN